MVPIGGRSACDALLAFRLIMETSQVKLSRDKSSANIGICRGNLNMSPATQQRTRALNLLKKRGMLRLKDFMSEGIGAETLARLVRDEVVMRPARGLYQLPVPPGHAAHTLAEA